MTFEKKPISAFQLPPVSHLLQHNLTPDPVADSVKAFSEVLATTPSVQRRSRLLKSSAHFSYVSPLPISFPYRIEIPEDDSEADKSGYIERWLSRREPREERPGVKGSPHLKKYSSTERDTLPEANILALAPTTLTDYFPQLDVGDSFEVLGEPALSAKHSNALDDKSEEQGTAVREELVNILSGRNVLFSLPTEESSGASDMPTPYAPWSLRYSGHQFGVWAGQLGDGRAISILEVAHPNDPESTYEIQLKGAGRTPFSRGADGLAVLRSSIREFLCAEAMNALHIPTTRSLSIVHIPDLPVARETMESASIVARVAPSFIRIGSFEALNPPQDLFFFGGGGQQQADYEALRILGEWVSRRVLKLNIPEGEPWGKALVWECARRNAKMAAGWQAYGFMHGVMNTDNISIMGLTIDYGPYAFMDVYDSKHICNHTDQEGRYAFELQPTMILYALRALLTSLAPLIGAELETGKAVGTDWASSVSAEKIKEWSAKAQELSNDLEVEIQDVFSAEYWTLMRKRLGLRTVEPADESQLIRPMLRLLEEQGLDFHRTFRALCAFRPTQPGDETWDAVAKTLAGKDSIDDASSKEWKEWLSIYSQRINRERSSWKDGDAWIDDRAQVMKAANPRFVLRQWLLEELIAKCEKDPDTGKRILAKVLKMASSPFEPWGAEEGSQPESELSEETREERRYCDVGEKQMLGFQCSCSS
ncbi:UPF0061-domain-containing protein [Sistotremastrum niveocremeum HHB9708]|uniref:Selenoprotein O n=1 Tax=Sistotremastrum niveocremeum HHB9708 TaxID=1314777 RepID=A0A164VJ80_9AGAM|nr:UPF0061-domain-containing protein [Sistotremastrum niveocremeum HHB9708]